MANITRGVASILFGNVGVDGGPGTTLAALGLSKRDSVKLNQADPTINNIFTEEQDAPIDAITVAGDLTLELELANPDTDAMVKIFGGTATGTSPNKIWNYPAAQVTVNQTVKINTTKGMGIIIPNGQVIGSITGNLNRTEVLGIKITVKALAPTKAGVGQIQFTE